MSVPNGIILFWYRESPYGRRLKSYLTLRQIQHAECIQPPILPRPDLDALGIKYRRSPVMTIGRDVYLDTRLAISKLEEHFPASSEHPGLSSPETFGMAALLQEFVTGSMFSQAVRQIPQEFAMLQNPKFQKDRANFFGPDWKNKGAGKVQRPEAMAHMRRSFDIAESLFVDGREWVAGTKELSLADLEGIWVFDWFIGDLRATKEYFGEKQYPKVHAWRERYRKALSAAKARAPKGVSLQGSDAVAFVCKAAYTDTDLVVDGNDPLKLKAGSLVEVFPTEGGGGYTHQDQGQLLKLNKEEVAIAVQSRTGEEIHVHAPRWQFRVRSIEAAKL